MDDLLAMSTSINEIYAYTKLMSDMLAEAIDDYKALVIRGIVSDFKQIASVTSMPRYKCGWKCRVREGYRNDDEVVGLLYLLNDSPLITAILDYIGYGFVTHHAFKAGISKWEADKENWKDDFYGGQQTKYEPIAESYIRSCNGEGCTGADVARHLGIHPSNAYNIFYKFKKQNKLTFVRSINTSHGKPALLYKWNDNVNNVTH
jgi:hypothetical protein